MQRLILLACIATLCLADIYMHCPVGSNNRNRERNENRANANRLFDSQNNGKGGYPYRGDPSIRANPDPLTYYSQSTLRIEWTNQHGCGPDSNVHCQLVIQYACDDTLEGLRDGYPNGETCYDSSQNNQNNIVPCNDNTTWTARTFVENNGQGTNTIPNPNRNEDPAELTRLYINGEDDYVEYGLHESPFDYIECQETQRNMGLYTSDQDLNGDSARYTRQNPNGARRGLECPEERDYYPYWRPNPWKDIAILASNTSHCPFFQSQSHNVRSYGRCNCINPSPGNPCPINQNQCNAQGFNWEIIPSHGIPAPDCLYHPFNRDNHLGNAIPVNEDGVPFQEGSQPENPFYDWVIPNDLIGRQCIVRIRYNMSTGDYDSQAFADESNAACNNVPVSNGLTQDLESCGQGVGLNNGGNCPFITVSTDCMNEQDGNPDCFNFVNGAPPPGAKSTCYNELTPFTVPLYNRPYINLFDRPLTAQNGLPPQGFRLGLAINTHQTGRTFQDRSYVFQVAQAPIDAKIYNLQLRGRRGNIVQAYPSVEYDWCPSVLECEQGAYIHLQVHGSDFNAARNANNGEGWQYSDRSNMVEMDARQWNYPLHHLNLRFFSEAEAVFWAWVGQDPARCDTTIEDDGNNNQNSYTNCGKLNQAPNRFPQNPADGLISCDRPLGSYFFMSTRNNNFSNRSQKSQIVITEGSSEDGLSVGAIVAISFAVVFFVGMVGAGVAIYMKKKQKGCFAPKEGAYAHDDEL